MSRFDAEYEAECRREAEQDAKAFVVGSPVWRANYDRVEEGALRKAARCNLHGSCEVEHPNGQYPYYLAEFPTGDRWVSQTFSWRFFASKQEAYAELVEAIEGQIREKQRDLDKLQKRLLEAQVGASVPTPSPSG